MTTKTCSKCGDDRPLESFHKSKTGKLGRQPMCKVCKAKWAKDNRESHNARRRKRYANDPEYRARRREERNPESTRRAIANWAKNNKKRRAMHAANRRAAKAERTPVWNDELVMRMIYEDCPEGHHVDHIVPLQGENVSGLHVHYNLQWLTVEENLRKGNRWP